MVRLRLPWHHALRHPFPALAWYLVATAWLIAAAPVNAQSLSLAIVLSRTGPGAEVGGPVLNSARLAVDEANADVGASPPIELSVYDDHSTEEGARDAARKVVASSALTVVGPGLTTSSLVAGPIFAEARLASVVPHAHGDGVTANATTFRIVFSTSEMGSALAGYLRYGLDKRRAIVISRDNGYGRPIAEGFRRVAESLGIATTYYSFKTTAEAEELARKAVAEPNQPAIVIGAVDTDVVPILKVLRRQRAHNTILGPSAIAVQTFPHFFQDEPEERQVPGFFTDGVYGISPVMLDSANAETLAFAERYRARYGIDPSWPAVQGYDATRLAIAAIRTAAANGIPAQLHTGREAVLAYLASLDSPEHAVASLTGPLWFSPDHGRRQATRIGRFHGTLLESAPVQLVIASNPSAAELDSGAVLQIDAGNFVRRQQVVYTGVYVNEISRLDIAQSTVTADLYLWLRYAKRAGAEAADPTDIDFPDMVRGNFDAHRPSAQGDLDDGTVYRMWRVRGDFKNDFDLHHYPFDRQRLTIRLFNARAASDRIVYVQDHRSIAETGIASLETTPGAGHGSAQAATVSNPSASAGVAAANSGGRHGGTVSPIAFRNLTQWDPTHSEQRRDVLVTDSALGDPRLVGVEQVRELSGYILEVTLARRTMATLAKTLLPLGIMALIMFASLWFSQALVKEKITVAITGALSGAVLLSAVNSQLGAVGYTMAVEYVFYVFFGLCLLCITAVLAADRLRVAGHDGAATITENLTRGVYLVTMLGVTVAAVVAARQW
jgi:branched-chain amino acid transport system substrate-binding protein